MADVKVIRGAELHNDHCLVLMKVDLRQRKPRRKTEKSGRARESVD